VLPLEFAIRARVFGHDVRVAANFVAASYDEDDDGFQFSRTRSKKSKTPAPTEEIPVAREVKAQPARRKRNSVQPQEPADKEAEPKRRRSKRLSGEKIVPPKETASRPQQTNGLAKRPVSPAGGKPLEQTNQQPQTQAKGVEKGRSGSPSANHSPLTISKKRDGTKIALPFADTPIIKRNKELRKTLNGSRRSSSGMRGRRASSLIESGASNGGQNFKILFSQDSDCTNVLGVSPKPDPRIECINFFLTRRRRDWLT